MYNGCKVVAVIPAYNEEITVGSIVLKTKKYVNEVVVVDDGSTDDTQDIAKCAGAKVLKHGHNLGKGAALRTGIQYVINEMNNIDIIVCMDADGQHNPEDIPALITPIRTGEAKFTIASRFLNKVYTKLIPKHRRLGLRILTFMTNLGWKSKVTDSQNGFRAFSTDIADIFKFTQTDFGIESEMIQDAYINNVKIKEVSIPAKYSELKKKNIDTSTLPSQKHGFKVLNFLISLVRDKHPLLFFGLPGTILVLISILAGMYTTDFYFKYKYVPYTGAVVTVGTGFTGTLCLFIGLTLSAIGRIIETRIAR